MLTTKRNFGRLYAFLILLALFIFLLVPFEYAMPVAGLDPSWRLGMNVAASRGLAFGHDVIFTFGPLARIYSHYYSPGAQALPAILEILLACAFAFSIWKILDGCAARASVLVAVFAMFLFYRDALFASYGLFYVFSLKALLDRDATKGGPAAVLLALPLAILPLIKGTFLMASVFYILLAAAVMLLRGRHRTAFVAVLAYVTTLLALWVVSGQQLSGIVQYFLALRPIVSGYSEAMSLPGPKGEILAYLVGAVAAIALMPRREFRDTPEAALFILALTFFLFLSFKEGFVRHDGHALVASSALCLCAVIALRAPRGAAAMLPVRRMALLIVLIASGFYIESGYMPFSVSQLIQNAKSKLPDWNSATSPLHTSTALQRRYVEALKKIQREHPLEKLDGPTDIYPINVASLIASGNTWDPRPVFQSYSAYTASLARINRDHLLGPSAPRNIIFSIQPIDGRFPTLADGASWPVILDRYRLFDVKNGFAYLRRDTGGDGHLGMHPLGTQRHSLGQEIALPRDARAIFMKIDARQSLPGKIANILFKTAPLEIRLKMADGSTRKYRVVSGMMRAGFVISPIVSSTQDFMMLATGNLAQLSGARPVSFRITTSRAGMFLWKPKFSVTSFDMTLPPRPLPESVLSPRVVPASDPVSAAKCHGYIDFVNTAHVAPGKKVPAGPITTISGWLTNAPGISGTPTRVLIEEDTQARRSSYHEAERVKRPDVRKVYKIQDPTRLGFSAIVDNLGLADLSSLTVLAQKDGKVIRCGNLRVEFGPAEQ